MSWHFSQELGGGILGGALLGWTTVGAVEIEKYPRECLLQRQRDGILPPFPVWDDVCTFNGNPSDIYDIDITSITKIIPAK